MPLLSQRRTEVAERQLAGVSGWGELTAGFLLTGPERPGLDPARRSPYQSANQHCELIRATDEWVAAQLARPVDHQAVPAVAGLLGVDLGAVDPWPAPAWEPLRELVRRRDAAAVVGALRTLGVAAAVVGEAAEWPHVVRASGVGPAGASGPVVDLSALWAGPLAAKLIGIATGAEVVDVESTRRLDPMRLDSGQLGHWLHDGRGLELFDHRSAEELQRLRGIVGRAAVVVTAGRRRALSSLGLDPEALVSATGAVWVHLSGYGLRSPLADAAAFGDDAAAAAGLVDWVGDEPRFVADAVADPLAGVAAARAAVELIEEKRGGLLDVSLAGVAAAAARGEIVSGG